MDSVGLVEEDTEVAPDQFEENGDFARAVQCAKSHRNGVNGRGSCENEDDADAQEGSDNDGDERDNAAGDRD